MTEPQSTLTAEDWKDFYPTPAIPYDPAKAIIPGDAKSPGRYIEVSDGHKLYAQEFGNPNGEPIIFLHGGPGARCSTDDTRYFDPQRYRIILFDQRGCGFSNPTTTSDPVAAMKGNDTAHIVEDINAVRKAFGVRGKMHLEGGSWGATLALMYSIKYPENVKSMVLRGVFLGRPAGLKYMFQGNAATYEPTPNPITISAAPEARKQFEDYYYAQPANEKGGYRAFQGDAPANTEGRPPAELRHGLEHMKLAYAISWDEFVRLVPKPERTDMIAAYDDRLKAKADPALDTAYDPAHPEKSYDRTTGRIAPKYQQRLAFAFSKWEAMIGQFSQAVEPDGTIDLGKFEDPHFAVDFARLEAHFTREGFFISEDGEAVPGGRNYILENLDRIAKKNIPIFAVHGANDQVCEPIDAQDLKTTYDKLVKKLHKADAALVELKMPARTSHTMREKENSRGVKELADKTPRMTELDYEPTGVDGPNILAMGAQTQRILDRQAERDKTLPGKLGL